MRKEKRLAKAMITLFIDDEQKKLSDKYNDLKLSHNRRTKLLKQTYEFLKNLNTKTESFSNTWWGLKLKEKIQNELDNPYYRRNWGYQHKQEPGHYCG